MIVQGICEVVSVVVVQDSLQSADPKICCCKKIG